MVTLTYPQRKNKHDVIVEHQYFVYPLHLCKGVYGTITHAVEDAMSRPSTKAPRG